MKCTIKDIVRETGFSRNTVSKALKRSEEVSPRTIDIIIKKATEMGYFSDEEKINHHGDKGNILFLTTDHANDSEFWSTVLTGINAVISKSNYQLTISTLSKDDINNNKLPDSLYNPNVKGIIVVEMNFRLIWEMMLKLNVPIVTVDAPQNYEYLVGKCDIVMMENESNVRLITQLLIDSGFNDFAFIGDLSSPNTGLGFKERYVSLVNTLNDNRLSLNIDCSIIHKTDLIFENFDSIIAKLKDMESLPQVFICGNDWLAIQLIYGIQSLGYTVPNDVNVVGFDNISNSERILPSLTTINTPKSYLGKVAAYRIIERLNDDNVPCVVSKYATQLLLRNSADIRFGNETS